MNPSDISEGAIVSMPLLAEGTKRQKTFCMNDCKKRRSGRK